MSDMILEKMFEIERWTELIDKADMKGINPAELRKFSSPEGRIRFYDAIISGCYEIAPPHIAQIPKDNGEFREVYVNENADRIFLSLANDVLTELLSDMIHPNCKSYQKGIGCGKIVQNICSKIGEISNNQNHFIGYKTDLSKYFDTVPIEIIDKLFDEMEKRTCQSPVFKILRNYYHNDLVFNVDGNLMQHYGSLKQGCAVAAFLSNIALYDIDERLSKMNILYIRYSDDILMLGKDSEEALEILSQMLNSKSLKLNPKKVESLFNDKWFKFLGFNIKGNMITLSAGRVKNFQKEIEARTIRQNISANKARRQVIDYLYKGNDEFSWASGVLPIVNVKKDVDELNKFVMDCVRACETGKKKIGGLGSVRDREDYTILRGTGKNVSANRVKTEKGIENYLTLGCMQNAIKTRRGVYETLVRQM